MLQTHGYETGCAHALGAGCDVLRGRQLFTLGNFSSIKNKKIHCKISLSAYFFDFLSIYWLDFLYSMNE